MIIVILSIFGYLVIGGILGRLTFSYLLEDNRRWENNNKDQRTDDYKFAMGFGWAVWMLWPIIAPFVAIGLIVFVANKLLTRETRKERKIRKDREATKLASEANKAAREAGLPEIPN